MKNTAKTLTLTAKKAPAKTTAQLAVPKTATSYFLETEAAAKVTVVKTRSRLASLKAAQAEETLDLVQAESAQLQSEDFDQAVAAGAAAAEEAVAEPAPAVAPVAAVAAVANDEADPIPTPTAPAAPPVIVRKRGSKLAALKAVESAPAVEAAPAVETPIAAAEQLPAAAVVRTRARRVGDATGTPRTATAAPTGAVSTTTDAAALAAIDTSGYMLPGVKVPGRRGRKPSEFVPENDEIAALNAVERAEMKAASKLRERKAKGIPAVLGVEQGFSGEELEKRRQQLKNLINMGKDPCGDQRPPAGKHHRSGSDRRHHRDLQRHGHRRLRARPGSRDDAAVRCRRDPDLRR
jgi:RNA polymerase primary sigma factor